MRNNLKKTPVATRQLRGSPQNLKFRHILVPLDFSGFSRQALACAVPLARAHGAKISLVHVVQLPVMIEPMPGGGTYSGSYLPISSGNRISEVNAVGAAKAQLDKLAVQLLPASLRNLKVIRVGNAAYEVVSAAKALKADLIVLSAHGQSRLKHLMLGSTAERIVRHASCPVLTVRSHPGSPALRILSQEKPVYPARLPWRRLLVPLDFSPTSLGALQVAVPLARQSGAQLLLLNVVEPNPYPTGMDGGILTMPDAVMARNARAHLPRVAKRWVPESVHVTSLVGQGRAASVIVDTAEEKGVDLIVLSTHGHAGLERLLMGSTAEQVVRHAQCPVLVVRKLQSRGRAADVLETEKQKEKGKLWKPTMKPLSRRKAPSPASASGRIWKT
jgi:nucleotide-binding universal stress UspA family protein